MKKKLLIFHPYLTTYRIDLYNRFVCDYEVRVVLTGHPNEISGLGFDVENVNNQAKFDYKYYNNGLFFGRQQITSVYFKVIKEFKPDIVLCHEYGFNTLAAIMLKSLYKYKLFLTCDDSYQMACSYGIKRKLLRNFVVKNADGILVVSSQTKNFLEKNYLNPKCKFIYFPIIQDDALLSDKIINSKSIAKNYAEKYYLDGKKILLYVGRFALEKNISLLLESYSRIKTPDDILVLVGNGNQRGVITNLIENLELGKNVILTGSLYAENLYAWYYLCDVFVLPSKKEAFGAVVNEALVAGCFSVVSNSAGASCLINDGQNGYVFESENIVDLSDKLQMALKREKKSVCASIMSRCFDSFYKDLLNAFEGNLFE
ncbi:hypothetical protein B7990_03180 [Fibrobacter sp. UWB4]|uniref:glycosyltransferase family 4 protein n=1 Tax=Fibrobacter sp. UWB4 TaxID=1964356 RepID=UPI000B51F6C3|nr:glycosyltransferase family 4 protein [Fibrobacter sp. UWB4]OWV20191.1 hypothetical protein B7990_03180 [Fibrobacter sp. UWB4]